MLSLPTLLYSILFFWGSKTKSPLLPLLTNLQWLFLALWTLHTLRASNFGSSSARLLFADVSRWLNYWSQKFLWITGKKIIFYSFSLCNTPRNICFYIRTYSWLIPPFSHNVPWRHGISSLSNEIMTFVKENCCLSFKFDFFPINIKLNRVLEGL